MEFKFLENLKEPNQLKEMSVSQLKLLADEIRQALILNVSNTGGHLASNLGVVELSIAIHRVFNSPEDQIVFDVGHQCYVHKMLTGRYDKFSSLRKKDGLSGFPSFEESKHDIFKTGHSSTSISSALGLSYANSILNRDFSTVAVIGDGSMTGGLAYEGLNNAGSSKKNLVVILNDNKMSISKNVGSISKVLTKLRNKTSYFKFKDIFAHFIISIPCIGKGLYRRIDKLKSAIKSYYYSSNIFENMGFKYIGPVDGHDIELLIRILNRAKSLKCPVLVHVNTTKGKGYSFAENSPDEYHGVGEFDVNTGASDGSKMLSFTDVFGRALVDIAKYNDKVCSITAAMGESCGLKSFSQYFPKRFFDVGIAEQHAVTFASGLAKNGFIPVVSLYSTFLQRAYDQVIHDVSLQKLKVIFAIDRAGIVGNDGETHQGMFDIPMFLPIPWIKIYSPSTGTELENTLKKAVDFEKESVVIRFPKAKAISYSEYPFDSLRDWQILHNGSDTLIVSYGVQIFEVLEANKKFKFDILKLNLINRFGEDILNELSEYKKIIFVEECFEIGGVGMLLLSKLNSMGIKSDFHSISVVNSYIKHASQEQAKFDVNLKGDALISKIKSIVE